MCHYHLDSFTHCFREGEVMGPLSRPVVSQSYTFECADAKWVAIHMSSPPKFWTGFLEPTGQVHLAADPRFAARQERIRRQDDLIDLMTPVFLAQPRAHWCAALEAAEVPCSPARDSDEALEDSQAQHLGIKVSADHAQMGAFATVRAPYSFDGEADRAVLPPPMLNEHGAEIRDEL